MTVKSILEGQSDLITVRHVVARGNQREIGRTLAAAAHAAHGNDCRPGRVDPAVERVRRRWFELHHPVLRERGRGIGEYFAVDPTDTSVALDALGTFARRAGCSVAFYPGDGTQSGHALLGRNFDFPTTTMSEFQGRTPIPGERAAVADPWIVELHPDEGHASVCIGIGDVMGGMDGINAAGLGVALLADDVNPPLEPSWRLQVGLSEGQVVRYLLDTCSTVDEAKDALRIAKHYYQGLPCHFVVADKSGASFVWEHSRHRNWEFVVEGREDGRLICTNHLLHQWPDASGQVDSGAMGTATKTFERWRTLTMATTRSDRVHRDDVRQQLAAVRATSSSPEIRTIWHAIYDLSEPSVEFAFYLKDIDATSTYSAPICIELEAPVPFRETAAKRLLRSG